MKIFNAVTLIAVVMILNACKHKADSPPAPPACIAGSGGNVIMVVYANFGSTPIPNYFTHPDTAFVKFGTKTSPGTQPGNFDIYFVSEPGEDHIHCPGLKCGDYFIYRTAWDSLANVFRYGGFGISVTDTAGEQLIHVAVN
jgi:hypothetical protein